MSAFEHTAPTERFRFWAEAIDITSLTGRESCESLTSKRGFSFFPRLRVSATTWPTVQKSVAEV